MTALVLPDTAFAALAAFFAAAFAISGLKSSSISFVADSANIADLNNPVYAYMYNVSSFVAAIYHNNRNKIETLMTMRLFVIAAALFATAFPALGEDAHSTIVSCTTTKGPIKIEVIPGWAPYGANRFLELVADNFFTNIAFFRCVKGFLTQFGLSTDPRKKHWHYKTIPDDPHNGRSIDQYVVSYAGSGPNSRSTQLFFAFEDLDFLGKAPWEVPFGRIIDGFDTLNSLYKGYGDIPPYGKGPDQQLIQSPDGEQYLKDNYPKLDYLLSCSVLETDPSMHLLRGSEDKEKNIEVQERAGEEVRQEPAVYETAESVGIVLPATSGSGSHGSIELPRADSDNEVVGVSEKPNAGAQPDLLGTEPSVASTHTNAEKVSKPDETNRGTIDKLGDEAEEHFLVQSNKADDDDTIMLSSRMSDREAKIRIIFLLLITVLGMLAYNIWRNKRKIRVGKLT